MSVRVGSTIRWWHKVLDSSGAAVSGLDATAFDVALQRDDAPSTETVAVDETSSAVYEFSFVPALAGEYALPGSENATIPLSRFTTFAPTWTVVPVGAEFAPTYDNAFCGAEDVERYAGRPFDSATLPTAEAVAGFAEEVAADIMSKLPPGQSFTPVNMGAPVDTSTDVGKILEDALRAANAVGAAARALRAAYSGAPPNESKVPEVLEGVYLGMVGGYDPIARHEVVGSIMAFIIAQFPAAFAYKAGTHVSVGDVTVAPRVGAPPETLPLGWRDRF